MRLSGSSFSSAGRSDRKLRKGYGRVVPILRQRDEELERKLSACSETCAPPKSTAPSLKAAKAAAETLEKAIRSTWNAEDRAEKAGREAHQRCPEERIQAKDRAALGASTKETGEEVHTTTRVKNKTVESQVNTLERQSRDLSEEATKLVYDRSRSQAELEGTPATRDLSPRKPKKKQGPPSPPFDPFRSHVLARQEQRLHFFES